MRDGRCSAAVMLTLIALSHATIRIAPEWVCEGGTLPYPYTRSDEPKLERGSTSRGRGRSGAGSVQPADTGNEVDGSHAEVPRVPRAVSGHPTSLPADERRTGPERHCFQ
jgi:hypothetical protein